MPICSHWLCIMWQQERSSVVMGALGVMQAMAGDTKVAANKTKTPSWRSIFTLSPMIFEIRG